MVPLESEIQRLHKRLEMPRREFEEDELAGPSAVPDRTEERDNLLARLAKKKQVDPLIAQIQRLRKQLDLSVREFDDDELFGPTAVEDRTAERDGLKEVVPLVNDIQKLHKKLAIAKRDFEEGVCTRNSLITNSLASSAELGSATTNLTLSCTSPTQMISRART